MEIIRDIDFKWFNLGYMSGLAIQTPKQERPNKVKNIGKQGVSYTPTNKQRASFTKGLYCALSDYANSWNIPNYITIQDLSEYKSKGLNLTLEIGKVKALRGQIVKLPLFICNNRVDNRGFCSYQAKIKFNQNNLIFQSITPSSTWTGSFTYQQDAGILLVEGINEEISYEDCILAYIEFLVSDTAPSTNAVVLDGTSAIITKTLGIERYIYPKNLKSGEVLIDGEVEKQEDSAFTGVYGDSSDSFGYNTTLDYNFNLTLGYIGNSSGGSSVGGGADLIVNVTFGDGTKQQVSIPLEEGTHNYKGKLHLRLPSLSKGPIYIEYYVKPKNEDDLYYWFVDGVAYWLLETEIPREEVNQMPIIEPIKKIIDYFEFFDFATITKSGSPEPPPIPSPTYQEIAELLDFFDVAEIEKFIEKLSEDTDSFSFSDDVIISKE